MTRTSDCGTGDSGEKALRSGRSERLSWTLQLAYRLGLPVRAIILDGEKRDHFDAESKSSEVENRLLDSEPWAVVNYNMVTGDCVLVRGVDPTTSTDQDDPEIEGFEGATRKLYILHRRREASLRRLKIEAALIDKKGVLQCEVPNCGFDFYKTYGEIGRHFAHIHHLKPLAGLAATGEKINLKDLAIVCANCHAMIHRGGECRELKGLIPRP